MELASHMLREKMIALTVYIILNMASLSAESKSTSNNNIFNKLHYDTDDEIIGNEPKVLTKKTRKPDPLIEPPSFDPEPTGLPPVSILVINFIESKLINNENQR